MTNSFVNTRPIGAFEVPDTPGVKFHSMVTAPLRGNGTIERIINNSGGRATAGSTEAYLAHYPNA